jgi:hypothetical protein
MLATVGWYENPLTAPRVFSEVMARQVELGEVRFPEQDGCFINGSSSLVLATGILTGANMTLRLKHQDHEGGVDLRDSVQLRTGRSTEASWNSQESP